MRRLVFATIAALFLAALLLPTQSKFVVQAVSEGERLAMFSKPAVVRTIDGAVGQIRFTPNENSYTYNVGYYGYGSGFFISANGYIATNAHCVDLTHGGEQKMKDILFGQMLQQIAKQLGKEVRQLNSNFIAENSSFVSFTKYHHVLVPDGTFFPFEIKQFGAPTGEGTDQGKDVAIIKIEVKHAPVLLLGDSEKVQLQEHVTVVGYPAAADTSDSGLLDRKSALEASITDGKISARKASTSGAPILQTSAPATHGNSGGPLLSDAQQVIGLLTFGGDRVGGQEIQGFTFVVPSNTVMEYVKSAGVTNELGTTDKLYQEGLESYWNEHYSDAITNFQQVKTLFPQHSEVDRLLQSSQQAKSEGKDRSSFPFWIIGVVVAVVILIGLVLIIIIVIVVLARKKGKPKQQAGPTLAKDKGGKAQPAPGYSPSPAANSPSPAAKPAPAPIPTPVHKAGDQGMTVDLSRTVAISPEFDTAPINYGTIKFVSGALAGKEFQIKPEGEFLGRDSGSAQVVIPDPRISKRHLWIGVRDGRVVIVDQESRNGTFVNDPKSPRVTETSLSPGDTVILGESDVARFEYVN